MGTNLKAHNSGASTLGFRSVMRVRTLDESLHGSQHTQLSASRRSTNSNVSFNKVSFREYPMVLGDNPSVSEGPPLTIGWDTQDEYEHNLDEYEEGRGERRETFQMVIPRKGREQLLKTAGHSRSEFASIIRQNTKIKNQRKATVRNLNMSKTEEKIEKVTRKMKGLFKKKKKIEYNHTWDPNADSECESGISDVDFNDYDECDEDLDDSNHDEEETNLPTDRKPVDGKGMQIVCTEE